MLNAPIIAREARVVGKRQDFLGGGEGVTTTRHYMTFEFADGGRQEFYVEPAIYGVLVEGDRGTLRYQGIRYKGFDS